MYGLPEKCLSCFLGTFLSSQTEDWHKLSALVHRSKKGDSFLPVALEAMGFQNAVQEGLAERESLNISLYSEEVGKKSDFPACICPSWAFVMLFVLFCSD